MSWIPNPSEVIEIAKAGATVVGWVVDLVKKAIEGDPAAHTKLRRVEAILSPVSPTESAFKRMDEIAKLKTRDPE